MRQGLKGTLCSSPSLPKKQQPACTSVPPRQHLKTESSGCRIVRQLNPQQWKCLLFNILAEKDDTGSFRGRVDCSPRIPIRSTLLGPWFISPTNDSQDINNDVFAVHSVPLALAATNIINHQRQLWPLSVRISRAVSTDRCFWRGRSCSIFVLEDVIYGAAPIIKEPPRFRRPQHGMPHFLREGGGGLHRF